MHCERSAILLDPLVESLGTVGGILQDLTSENHLDELVHMDILILRCIRKQPHMVRVGLLEETKCALENTMLVSGEESSVQHQETLQVFHKHHVVVMIQHIQMLLCHLQFMRPSNLLS